MKRIIAVLIGLSVLMAFSAFAQAPAKEHKAKATHMTVTGKVQEVTATDLKIERVVKEKAEVMEFTLSKALTGVAVGDEVVVAYHVKDGKNIVVSVHKPIEKKAAPAPAPAAPEAPKK